jgi:hypothetical protein
MDKHTPGPLSVTQRNERQYRIESDHAKVPGNWDDIYVEFSGFFGSYGPHMFAAAPEMLAHIESEYAVLSDVRNEWPGRSTPAGQHRLCILRDLICKATGRDPQDVQDDYSNRNLVVAGEAS